MKLPVDTVRVSARGKDILIKIKRHTGLQHWNEICRIALCRSLSNLTAPPKQEKTGDSSIEMDWKTFSGSYQQEIAALILLRAAKDRIDLTKKDNINEYFRLHLERGIASMQNVRSIKELIVKI